MGVVGSQADNQHILMAADAGIYNVRKGTCNGTNCVSCNGATSYSVAANPFTVGVGGQTQLSVTSHWNTGQQYDLTNSSTWGSSNTSVATVQTGMTTGVSAGTVTMTASNTTEPVYISQDCQSHYTPTCPVASGGGGGGSGSVSQFSVAYSAYIPVDHVSGPDACLYAGLPYILIYMGDANRGTYRTTESITVVPDTQMSSGFFPNTGQTRNYGAGSPANGSTLSGADEDNIANDCHLWNASQTASHSGFLYDVSFPYAHQGQVHFDGSSSNPLEPPAPILWDMRTVIDTTNPLAPTALVNYNHTCYPSHQIKVNAKIVYLYTPPRNDATYIFGCLTGLTGKIIGQQTTPTQVPSY